MDDEALHRTLTTGRATYWSRSRGEYWVKGETSGNRQWVRGVRARLRRRRAAGARRPGGRGLPHRRAHLLPPGAARAEVSRAMRFGVTSPTARGVRGSRPAGGAGDPAAARRQRDRRSASTASSRATGRARCCWSRPSRASVVALQLRRRAQRRRRSPSADGGTEWLGDAAAGPHRRPAGRPAGRRPRRWPGGCARPRLPGLPPLTGGLVGYLGYDVVRRLERLPDDQRRRPRHARARDDAGRPTSPCSTTPTAPCC